jgi:hypothetical protein
MIHGERRNRLLPIGLRNHKGRGDHRVLGVAEAVGFGEQPLNLIGISLPHLPPRTRWPPNASRR